MKLSLYVQELKESSLTDPLTGLANRRCLEKDGCKLIEICRRSGVTCCCLELDLDHFKHVNDTYGHQTGDVALQTVSTILKNNTRTSDICARFGGEEFIILASSTTAEAAMCLAEKIRAVVEKTVVMGWSRPNKAGSIAYRKTYARRPFHEDRYHYWH